MKNVLMYFLFCVIPCTCLHSSDTKRLPMAQRCVQHTWKKTIEKNNKTKQTQQKDCQNCKEEKNKIIPDIEDLGNIPCPAQKEKDEEKEVDVEN